MSYEAAPATRMLATHCAACARPLVDAKSVETGMGPDCRKRHGFNLAVSEDARAEANKLVHDIAVRQTGAGIAESCARLRTLGFEALATRIEERAVRVRIEVEGSLLLVTTPYSEEAVNGIRSVPGRRWDGLRKVNTVPATSRADLWNYLIRYFNGEAAIGPRGPFTVGARAGV